MRKRTRSYDAAEIYSTKLVCVWAFGIGFCLLFFLRPSTRAFFALRRTFDREVRGEATHKGIRERTLRLSSLMRLAFPGLRRSCPENLSFSRVELEMAHENTSVSKRSQGRPKLNTLQRRRSAQKIFTFTHSHIIIIIVTYIFSDIRSKRTLK